MHHIRLRCGWRAFFFERLAHSFVGERVDVGQRDQVRLLRTIKLSLVEARSRAVGSQGRLQALLDKALTQSLDGGDTRVKGVRDALVRPARPAFGLIRLAPGEQTLKLLALLSGERHAVLLG